MKKILFFAVAFTLFTTVASAQRGHDRVQRHRIEQGFKSGQLTRGEKFRLHQDRMSYRQAKRIALRDGRITRSERRWLNSLKRQDSRRIYAMKHNSRRRSF
jgi:hypothetical protein